MSKYHVSYVLALLDACEVSPVAAIQMLEAYMPTHEAEQLVKGDRDLHYSNVRSTGYKWTPADDARVAELQTYAACFDTENEQRLLAARAEWARQFAAVQEFANRLLDNQ
jgi:hypothetical protein